MGKLWIRSSAQRRHVSVEALQGQIWLWTSDRLQQLLFVDFDVLSCLFDLIPIGSALFLHAHHGMLSACVM